MASPKKVITDFIQDTYKIVIKDFVAVGITGCVPDGDGDIIPTDNAHNVYNDTIGWINPNERLFLRGTTEPGRTYTQTPMNPNGAFYLKRGLYQFVKAKHFGKDAFNICRGYPSGEVVGYRDKEKKGINPVRINPNAPLFKGSGIDIHAMGNNLNDIAGQSAGCQGPFGDWNSQAWKSFKDPLYSSKQKLLLYCLLWYDDIKVGLEA